MKKSAILIILLTIVPTTSAQKRKQNPPTPQRLSSRQIAAAALPSVVSIETDNGDSTSTSGSGFFIASGVLITNYHVIKRAQKIYVSPVVGSEINKNAVVFFTDEKTDLALLRVNNLKRTPLRLADSDQARAGDAVFVIGNPEGLQGTFSSGLVSAFREFSDSDITYIQFTAPISSGSSGGPVMNSYGEVIGITVALYKQGQNLNFAIPSSYVFRLINNYSASIQQQHPLIAPDTFFDKRYEQAQAFMRQGSYRDAIKLLLALLLASPNSPALNNDIGVCYSRLGRYHDATTYYSAALRARYDIPVYHLNLAESYSGLRLYSAAKTEYEIALKMTPDDAKARFLLGFVLIELGDFPAVLDQWAILDTLDKEKGDLLLEAYRRSNRKR